MKPKGTVLLHRRLSVLNNNGRCKDVSKSNSKYLNNKKQVDRERETAQAGCAVLGEGSRNRDSIAIKT